MSEPSSVILKAIRDSQPDVDAPTRIATVTGGNPTTVTVVFDGEAVASARSYVKTYSGASVGDRVIMLRSGTTWVAVARIGAPVTSVAVPASGSNTSTSVAYVNGATLTVYLSVMTTAMNASGAVAAIIPAGIRPPVANYFTGFDGPTGTPMILGFNTSGGIFYPAGRASGVATLGTLTYVIP